MQLHQLRYALAVGKQRSFSRAAEVIPVSVASVSGAIRDLEKELGVSLFERTTRSVRPTPAGELFLEHASKVVAEVEATLRDMESYRSTRSAAVVLGTTPSVVARNLPVLLESFQRGHPNVELRLVESNSAHLIDLLRARKVDIALHTGPPKVLPEDVEAWEIDRGETGIALAPTHPLASRETLELSSIAEMPMVISTPGHALREIALEVCQRAGVHPPIALETAVPDTIYSFVRAGLGFTIVSRSRAAAMGLSFVRCIPQPLPRILSLVWLRGSPLSASAELLRDEIYNAREWLI